MIFKIVIKMNDKIEPYLSRLNHDFGCRKNPYLIYVTRGGKLNSLIFHFKEENKYFQYILESVASQSVVLRCIYKRNSRSQKCPANIKISPNRPDLIYSKENNTRKRFYLNFDVELIEKSYEDWKVVKSNELPHSSFCNHQVPLKERFFSIRARKWN